MSDYLTIPKYYFNNNTIIKLYKLALNKKYKIISAPCCNETGHLTFTFQRKNGVLINIVSFSPTQYEFIQVGLCNFKL